MIIAIALGGLLLDPQAVTSPPPPAAALTRLELDAVAGGPSPQPAGAPASEPGLRTAGLAAHNAEFAGRLGVWSTAADTGRGSLSQSAAQVRINLTLPAPR